MIRLLSHPFRVGANNVIATVEQGSEDSYVEQLAVLMLTRVGERVLVPTFGIVDPAFNGLDKTEVVNKVNMFGPPVTIASITERVVNSTTSEVHVEFS